MQVLKSLKNELKMLKDSKKAIVLKSFFKTGKGEYGEGDIFFGITVPKTRTVAKKYFKEITLNETEELLRSKIHEERLCALLIMVEKFDSKETGEEKKTVFRTYLKNTKFINNWDLVDLSAHEIVGNYIYNTPSEREILKRLAESKNLWEKRIAIVSTYHFIYRKSYENTLKISKILLHDEQDLIQKAVGWMLREVGKRDLGAEERFLEENYRTMPRTMLRYAIEKFPKAKRKEYLEGRI